MNTSSNRLLVIDDDDKMCDLVVSVASELGFETDKATTFKAFKTLCREFHPHVIVMDLSMPEGDGIELLRFLSAERNQASIILMSGVDQKVLHTARRLGAEQGLNMIGALSKPFQVEELEGLLTAQLPPDDEIGTDELTEALQSDQIEVHYQPKVHVGGGAEYAIRDVEALVRWRHPERGLLMPDNILPVAEQGNLMLPLTLAVASKAFRQTAIWREKGLDLSVAINIAPTLLNNLELPDVIAELTRECGMQASHVMLEVTESGVMEDTVLAMDILTRFRLKGFQLSIDDYGTGFSSLAQLYKMPFSELKIDQSFIRDVTKSKDARVIVDTTIGMAKGLGLPVCAEGVENQEIFDFLVSHKCEKLQGYFISRPILGDAMVEFVSSWRPDRQQERKKRIVS